MLQKKNLILVSVRAEPAWIYHPLHISSPKKLCYLLTRKFTVTGDFNVVENRSWSCFCILAKPNSTYCSKTKSEPARLCMKTTYETFVVRMRSHYVLLGQTLIMNKTILIIKGQDQTCIFEPILKIPDLFFVHWLCPKPILPRSSAPIFRFRGYGESAQSGVCAIGRLKSDVPRLAMCRHFLRCCKCPRSSISTRPISTRCLLVVGY